VLEGAALLRAFIKISEISESLREIGGRRYKTLRIRVPSISSRINDEWSPPAQIPACAANAPCSFPLLNEAGIPTARGHGTWSAVQVARVLERLETA
jgi:hypothetical protein